MAVKVHVFTFSFGMQIVSFYYSIFKIFVSDYTRIVGTEYLTTNRLYLKNFNKTPLFNREPCNQCAKEKGRIFTCLFREQKDSGRYPNQALTNFSLYSPVYPSSVFSLCHAYPFSANKYVNSETWCTFMLATERRCRTRSVSGS